MSLRGVVAGSLIGLSALVNSGCAEKKQDMVAIAEAKQPAEYKVDEKNKIKANPFSIFNFFPVLLDLKKDDVQREVPYASLPPWEFHLKAREEIINGKRSLDKDYTEGLISRESYAVLSDFIGFALRLDKIYVGIVEKIYIVQDYFIEFEKELVRDERILEERRESLEKELVRDERILEERRESLEKNREYLGGLSDQIKKTYPTEEE